MSVFGIQADNAVKAMERETVKAKEFETGVTLQFQSVEKQKSRYEGAAKDSSIVERGVLDEGEQFLYSFKDHDGFVRKHYSHSFPLFIAMQGAEISDGEWLTIKRSGSGKETTYTVEKVEAPANVAPSNKDEEIDPSSIPF